MNEPDREENRGRERFQKALGRAKTRMDKPAQAEPPGQRLKLWRPSPGVKLGAAGAFALASAMGALLVYHQDFRAVFHVAQAQTGRDGLINALQMPESAETMDHIRKGLAATGRPVAFLDGGFHADMAKNIAAFLQEDGAAVETLAPWLARRMVDAGYGQTLTTAIFKTPGAWGRISTQIQLMTREQEDMEPADRARIEGWLLSIGVYDGPVDGRETPALSAALENLDHFFATGNFAFLNQQRTRAPFPAPGMERISGDDEHWDSAPVQGGPLVIQQPLRTGRISSRYGVRRLSFESRGRLHEGVDLAAPYGTPVHVAAAGVVVDAGRHGGYGNSVLVDHGHGIFTHYAHLSAITVRRGEILRPGEVLGRVGSTGYSTGNHLHFEVILHDARGRPIAVRPGDVMGQNMGNPQARAAAIADAKKISAHPVSRIVRRFDRRFGD